MARNRHLDQVVIAPPARGLRGFLRDLGLGWRLRQDAYDLAIDFHGGPRASLLTWLSGAPARIGYEIAGRGWMYTQRIARPRELRARHSVENQWDLLRPLGIPPPDRTTFPLEMAIDAASAAAVDDRLARAGVTARDVVIVIHVSAGNPFRRWPAAHFVELIVALAQGDECRRIVVTSGPSERDAAARVTAEARARLGSVRTHQLASCGEFSLAELRALVDRAALYIGGDSGPLHVAAATSVPIVGLYGPTLPARSAPWRDPQHPTESVDAGPLPCRPCDQRVCTPGDFRCLTSINALRVVESAARALSRARTRDDG
ncbi:MAG TPA: glycosyltransferase family 9 protein [Vicinamibacterales bacterium]|nr:glycosyltransferase family 9 protein [Vicinamibacterales bacterium]